MFWNFWGTILFYDKKFEINFFKGSVRILNTSPLITRAKLNFYPHFAYKPVVFRLANIQDAYVKDISDYRVGHTYSKIFLNVNEIKILVSCLELENEPKHIAKFIREVAKLEKQRENS